MEKCKFVGVQKLCVVGEKKCQAEVFIQPFHAMVALTKKVLTLSLLTGLFKRL